MANGFLAFALVIVSLLHLGCSERSGASTSTTQSGSPPVGSGATSSGGTLSLGGGIANGGNAGSGSCTRCSQDLHSVLDCEGNVIQACAANEGCSKDKCVPACDSATANKSSIGCDYYVMTPAGIENNTGSCFAAYIANTWMSELEVKVQRAGQSFDVSSFARIPSGTGIGIEYAPLPNGKIPPGEVAILFLSHAINGQVPCPDGVGVAVSEDTSIHDTGLGHAFHVSTSAPVVAYDIYPFGGGAAEMTSATLLLPTSTWDTNYIAVDAFRASTIAMGLPTVAIVAAEAGTDVTLGPKVDLVGGGVIPASPKGQPLTLHLGEGEAVQFAQSQELIGSPIQSNKPVGVWGGSSLLNVDVDNAFGDSAHQQIPPVRALGHEYVAVRYRNRLDGTEETPPWRLVGTIDGTTLTYEPNVPVGAPTTLAQGQLAEFRASGPFVVRSQDREHPFYMSAHMTGCNDLPTSEKDCRGDPEFVNVIPPEQFLPYYTFFADPTYPETNLVVVRKKGDGGFKDVELDCAGKLGNWTPIDAADSYEFTRFDLVRHDFEKQGDCDNGRREMKSEAPFGVTVWGWGTSDATTLYSMYVSYAFPAGASVQHVNNVVVPPKPE